MKNVFYIHLRIVLVEKINIELEKITFGSSFSQVRDVIDALLIESQKSDRLVVHYGSILFKEEEKH